MNSRHLQSLEMLLLMLIIRRLKIIILKLKD
nr:MAG TPA: hypothetical protein [Caudoviricetes sp.]